MQLILKDKKHRIGNVTSFIFEPSKPVTWQAGQFLHYTLKHDNPDERGIKRWFTIAAAPYEKTPTITTRIVESTFKLALNSLQLGDSIDADEPEGDFVWQDTNKPIVFVAGGIGVTPFYAILKDRLHGGLPLDVTLVYANRTDEIIFKAEFDDWQRNHPELKIHYLVGERLLQERLIELVPDLNASLVYVSGAEPMVEVLGNDLKEGGLAENQLKQDFFPGYTEKSY